MRTRRALLLIISVTLSAVAGCSGKVPVQPSQTPAGAAIYVPATAATLPAPSPSAAAAPVTALPPTSTVPTTQTSTSAPDPLPTLAINEWKKLPVISDISPRALEIYRAGVEAGSNPQAFSKIGDCGSTPAWFLGDYDRGPRYYNLGEYADLTAVIEVYQGSFDRTSLAARAGFNASSVFTTIWADRSQCEANETPLACEYRVHRPAMAFIMLGSNDVWHLDSFETQMRKIIEFSIEQGVVPILSTKADNLEKDESINATIARLAQEYEIPLINYWLAVQPLDDQGLQEDQVHLTWGPNRFDDPQAMNKAWPWRNLTALQMLDVFWRAAQFQP